MAATDASPTNGAMHFALGQPAHSRWSGFVTLVLQIGTLSVLIGFAVVVDTWTENLLLLMMLPALAISIVLTARNGLRQGEVVLGPESVMAGTGGPRSQRIAYEAIDELREFATVVEIVHSTQSVPRRWSLPGSRMAQADWIRFTTELKRRVRERNPAARIFDAATGPPPTPA